MTRELMGLTGSCTAVLVANVAHKHHKVASIGKKDPGDNFSFCVTKLQYWVSGEQLPLAKPWTYRPHLMLKR